MFLLINCRDNKRVLVPIADIEAVEEVDCDEHGIRTHVIMKHDTVWYAVDEFINISATLYTMVHGR